MSEWTLDLLPYILGLIVATAIIVLRPVARSLAPLYAPPRGALALGLTWVAAGVGMWAAFAVSAWSIGLAIAFLLASSLAAGLSVLAHRDARRSARSARSARE